jgi:hypothetical protein
MQSKTTNDGRVSTRIENYTKFWQEEVANEATTDAKNRLHSYTDVVNG